MNTVNTSAFRWLALAVALGLTTLIPLGAQHASQRSYDSPDQATDALLLAVTNNNMEELILILGPEIESTLSSGDPAADQRDRKMFVENYGEMHRFVMGPDKTATLYIGAENWPFPIPLVEKNGAWFFDTAKGKQEITFRRIGRNERSTIRTMRHLTDAQKEFAARLKWTTDTAEYAQKFSSDEGNQNGLYWKASDGSKATSPVGPLIAQAASEQPVPFNGYMYRMLERQGKSAPGGAKQYMANGKMTGGFAFVAYPASYRSSGVMTFITGQDGKVYEKDLGPNTARLASSMTTFNPDKSWKLVE